MVTVCLSKAFMPVCLLPKLSALFSVRSRIILLLRNIHLRKKFCAAMSNLQTLVALTCNTRCLELNMNVISGNTCRIALSIRLLTQSTIIVNGWPMSPSNSLSTFKRHTIKHQQFLVIVIVFTLSQAFEVYLCGCIGCPENLFIDAVKVQRFPVMQHSFYVFRSTEVSAASLEGKQNSDINCFQDWVVWPDRDESLLFVFSDTWWTSCQLDWKLSFLQISRSYLSQTTLHFYFTHSHGNVNGVVSYPWYVASRELSKNLDETWNHRFHWTRNKNAKQVLSGALKSISKDCSRSVALPTL